VAAASKKRIDLYDVVVVGSGVAGAIVSAQLVENGHKVLILEAGSGSLTESRAELVGHFVSSGNSAPESPYLSDDSKPLIQTPRSFNDDYFDQTSGPEGLPFKSNYERRLGGSTWHWLGNCPRHTPSDFSLNARYGLGVDWPIGYVDLEPWYTLAEQELGVSGDHEAWNGLLGGYRSQPYPMTKIWPSYGDQWVIDRLAGALVDGVPVTPISTPQARNSSPYQDRPACAGNSSCVPICPIQAKYDATVHLKRATNHCSNPAELRSKAVVVDLELDKTAAVSNVVYRPWDGHQQGELVRVQARVVVIAANAIETAKLLLMAKSEGAPNGLANSSDQVGRNLMDHLQGEVVCLTPEPIYPFRGPPTTCGIDGFRDGAFRTEHAAFRMSIGNDGWGRSETLATTLGNLLDEGITGTKLQQQLRDRVTRQLRISYSTEVLPNPDNRVQLSDQLDNFGLPRPKINFTVSNYNLRAFARAKSVASQVFANLGATSIKVVNDDPGFYTGAGHIMGTVRMGSDPASSVVDRHCLTHDHSNLYLIGAGVFPTAGTANPTLTLAALALRGAETIHKRLSAETAK
jgi:choline dehydrogenase-like flavoprotein